MNTRGWKAGEACQARLVSCTDKQVGLVRVCPDTERCRGWESRRGDHEPNDKGNSSGSGGKGGGSSRQVAAQPDLSHVGAVLEVASVKVEGGELADVGVHAVL